MANKAVLAAADVENYDHMNSKQRFQWFSLILYPDDRYHMIFLNTLIDYYTGFYIHHEADKLTKTEDGLFSDSELTKPSSVLVSLSAS